MTFQIIVASIAIIVLIGSLTVVGYSLYTNQHNAKFPPVSSECPDYWTAKDNICYNTQHLGTCGMSKNFNTHYFEGADGPCRRNTWAKNCGTTWDGITNNPKICRINL